MKRYLKDFELTYELVQKSIYQCLGKDKWTRKDTAYMFAEYVQVWSFEHTKSLKFQRKDILQRNINKIARNDKTRLYRLVDFIAEKIFIEISERKINLTKIRYEKRVDSCSGKEREIGISSIKQQCYDYIAVNICKEMFMAKVGHYQCASIEEKGQEFGKAAIETWIRTNPGKCKYIWKGDVKKFYPSVNHVILKKLLARDIKNPTVLYILFTLIDSYKQGLCIGSYLCQFIANYYLSYAYHFVSETLYVERRGKRINLVNHVLFYMDDLILFGSSKKNIKMAARALERYLNNKLGLQLKQTYQLFPLDSRPIDMMGYKIYTYKTTVRKTIFKRADRVFRKVKNNKFKMTLQDAYKIIAYKGYFQHSNSLKYRRKVKLDVSFEKAKGVISDYARSEISRKTKRQI